LLRTSALSSNCHTAITRLSHAAATMALRRYRDMLAEKTRQTPAEEEIT
jgi:hypothetical protein